MKNSKDSDRSVARNRFDLRLVIISIISAMMVIWISVIVIWMPGSTSRWERLAWAVYDNEWSYADPPLVGSSRANPGCELGKLNAGFMPAESQWRITRPSEEHPSRDIYQKRNITRVSRNDVPDEPWIIPLSSGEELRLNEVFIQHPISYETFRTARFRPGESDPFEELEVDSASISNPFFPKNSLKQFIDIGIEIEMPKGWRGVGVRDALTKRKCTLTWAKFGPESRRSATRSCHWHDGPIEFAMDIACGEPIIHEIDVDSPEANQQPLDLSNGRSARFLGFGKGRLKSRPDLYTEGIATRTLAVNPKGLETSSHVIFGISHVQSVIGIRLEALDETGKVIATESGFLNRTVIHANFKTPADTIRKLRFVHYPNFDRVLFTLPNVPGLPESNRGVANLFDARIPYFQAESADQIEEMIERSVQLKMRVGATDFPPGYFPKTWQDVSIAELLAEFDRYHQGRPFEVVGGAIQPKPRAAWLVKMERWAASVRGWF